MKYLLAKEYILSKLEKELSPNLYYHGIHHTIDVFKAVERFATVEGVKGDELTVLKTAALYHDAGFVIQYMEHEAASCEIAKETLSDFDYSKQEIADVCSVIDATDLRKEPLSLLQKIIRDADLDYFGRDDFFPTSFKLYREWNENGRKVSLKEWYFQQLKFVEKHIYFTKAAMTIRQKRKLFNLSQIRELLELNYQ
jgi:HD superfamily phosphodiesterase